MVNHHIVDIFAGLESATISVKGTIASGQDAAWKTIKLTRATHTAIPPRTLVYDYIASDGQQPLVRADALWNEYGNNTISVMWRQDPCQPLAVSLETRQ